MISQNHTAPPMSVESENAALGAILQQPTFAADVLGLVRPDDFYILRNTYVCQAITSVVERGELPDIVAVHDALEVSGHLADIGGMVYLTSLLGACPDPTRCEQYARVVARKAYRRRLLAAAADIHKLALDEELSDVALRGEVDARLAKADGLAVGDDPIAMHTLVANYFDHIEATQNLEGGITGLSVGFRDYDDLLDGLQPSSLNIIGARPAMGKTSLLLAGALNVARNGGAVYLWSGEMGRDQIMERLMAIESGIPARTLRRGLRKGGISIERGEWGNFVRYTGKLSQMSIFVDDMEGMTPALLRARIKRLTRRVPLALIIVDYLGLMDAGVKKENRENEVSYISRRLKQLAKVAPVWCAVQLNRGVENRPDKRPTMADLRDSGAQEQDADTVTFIYRDVKYNPNTDHPNRADLITVKNRHGGVATTHLLFEDKLTRFSEYTGVTVNVNNVQPHHANGNGKHS